MKRIKGYIIEHDLDGDSDNFERFVILKPDGTVVKRGIYAYKLNDVLNRLPELAESDDEKIRKALINHFKSHSSLVGENWNGIECDDIIAYLEKQKYASKAIEAVDRIDKYIDAHTANAHDMKDSNPDKKYYRGWDDALCEMARILQDVYSNEKQKESLHISETCKENADSFTDEDERIRKEIIEYFTKMEEATNGKFLLQQDYNKWIAYLEKEKLEEYSPLCNTIRDKIREYIANHFIADTVVKTDMGSIVKAMEEGVRLGKKEQKPTEELFYRLNGLM